LHQHWLQVGCILITRWLSNKPRLEISWVFCWPLNTRIMRILC